jgi:hypothetical protein
VERRHPSRRRPEPGEAQRRMTAASVAVTSAVVLVLLALVLVLGGVL